MTEQKIIELKSVSRIYKMGTQKDYALENINLTIKKGEFVTIVGKSGSGKSTLLNMLAYIDKASSGTVFINGQDIYKQNKKHINKWRGINIGIVFQFFQLLPTLTVLENVMLPMELTGAIPRNIRKLRAFNILEKVGLSNHIRKYPFELSGGEQQRCAIARAIANDAPILIADEPTGNLDSNTGTKILELLADLKAEGKTILMVTHERQDNRISDRKIELSDGKIISDIYSNKERENVYTS